MQRFESTAKNFFEKLGYFIIAAGIVIGMIVGGVMGSGRYERNWGMTLGMFVLICIPSIISGALMIAISEVLLALEKICNNIANLPNNESSNTNYSSSNSSFNSSEALNKLSSVASSMSSKSSIHSGEWVCPCCGNKNRSFDDYCSCGEPKIKKEALKSSGLGLF